jgi:thioredoxin-related protein
MNMIICMSDGRALRQTTPGEPCPQGEAAMTGIKRVAKGMFAALVMIGLMAGASPQAAAQSHEIILGDDGIHYKDWFLVSFLHLAEDFHDARAEGKRFVILWESSNCPYCRDLHQINFAIPEATSYIKERFAILQLNIFGSREVIDFDGEALTERQLARKYQVNFTPTMQFFPESLEKMEGKDGMAREVMRMPGYFRPFHFAAILEFVHDKRYDDADFQAYLMERRELIEKRGLEPTHPIVHSGG